MKLCVVGAGAIGGVLAARLALAGERVTLVVRNAAQRAAIARDGVILRSPDRAPQAARGVRAVATPREAGEQDVVLLAVKAHQIAGTLPDLRALFGPATRVVTLQNGIPWWYFERHGGPYEGRRLAALDPDGTISAQIEAERLIGGVVYLAGSVEGPGIFTHASGSRLVLGELDGATGAVVGALAERLRAGGIDAEVTPAIRAEIWAKAWANLCFNPICALTHARIGALLDCAPARALVTAIMAEVAAIVARLGVTLPVSIEERLENARRRVGGHKPSMLQDVEAGRGLEIEALVGAVCELGRMTATPTPHLDAVYACAMLLDRVIVEERVAVAARPL